MKRIRIYTLLLAIVIFSSCNLDYAPKNTLVDELTYKSETTAQAALLGAYARMNSYMTGSYPNYYSYMYADIGVNTLMYRATASSLISMETSDFTADDHSGFIQSCYHAGYYAVDYANAVIDGVTKYGNYNDKIKNQLVAEAKFLRAYVYMNMLLMYGDGTLTGNEEGLGLVLRLKPYEGYDPDEVQVREKISTIYNQIISDLTEAIPHLPATEYAVNVRCRATQDVCKAFLSRVYLYRGTFSNNREYLQLAQQYSKEVIDNGHFVFSTQYNDHRTNIFPNNIMVDNVSPDPENYSQELIFVQPSRLQSDDYPTGMSLYYAKRTVYIDPEFTSRYAEGDHRGYVDGSTDCLIQQGISTYFPEDNTTMKYDNSYGYSDVIFIRLSEIKLTYAEASARVSGSISQDALNHLNDIRCKPFKEEQKPKRLEISDFSSTDAFINEVLEEREKELAFEGHTRWDKIRTGRQLKYDLPNNKKMLPIPEYEIRISSGRIVQNSGYLE